MEQRQLTRAEWEQVIVALRIANKALALTAREFEVIRSKLIQQG